MNERMKLAVVIPAFNEEKNLDTLHRRLTGVLEGCCGEHELIFVNDGSRDGTLQGLRLLAEKDPRVKYVSLSRNFGHEVAVAAGLDRADADAVVLIDADLQDPPELIARMVERWKQGVDVVYAQRVRRRGDGALKRLSIYVFYRLLARISDVEIPLDTGNFRLMDRRVTEAVKRCRENPRYVRGLVPWVGFRQEALAFERDARHAGRTNYGLFRLVKLALDGIFSFSQVPLKIGTWIGGLMVALSVLGIVVVLADKLFGDPSVPRGFYFLACAMFFLGGVQMFLLGMLASYVGCIFQNVQDRPMYVVAEERGWRPGEHDPAPSARSFAVRGPAGVRATPAVDVVVRREVVDRVEERAGG
ncbi:MAG: glycosyltransferase family 2 protein [Phycisphaeraceae bacterium]|nr:glycosyltransferase family 2 protein [Phycisphaeraceae bacterium]